MSEHTERMGKENITKLLVQFSLPSTIAMFVMATYNIVDTMFVGRLGSEAIAALSVAFPLQMMLGALGIGTGVGAASLISRSLGAGNKEEAENAVGQVLALAFIFGFIVATAGFFFLKPLLSFLGATPEIMALSEEYMIVITSGSIMFFLIMILNDVVRAEGNPMLSMKVMILSAVINIALDPVFIFLLGMGVRGAAVATVLSKILGVSILLYYFFTGKSVIKLYLRNLKPRWDTIYNIYKVGLPAMILPMSKNISLIAVNNVLAVYGHLPIAVMGIVFRLQMFAFMPVVGIVQGLLPIIGYNYGANQLSRSKEAFLKGTGISTVFIILITIVYFSVPEFLFRLFNSESEFIALGSEALRIVVLMFPLVGVQIVSAVFFQAIGKGMPSLILSLLREIMIFMPMVIFLPGVLGLTGVWAARPLSDLLAFVIILLLITQEFKKQGLPINFNLHALKHGLQWSK